MEKYMGRRTFFRSTSRNYGWILSKAQASYHSCNGLSNNEGEATASNLSWHVYGEACPKDPTSVSERPGPEKSQSEIAKIIQIGWILGFTDGEGCFCVSFNVCKRLRLGIEVRPSFSVSQRVSGPDRCVNYQTLEIFLNYFGGGIRFRKRDNTWKYETRKLDILCNKVIPFFQKYSLQTSKVKDFQLFTEICLLIRKGQHLNKGGLEQIINRACQMNPSGKRGHSEKELLALIKRPR